MSNNIKLSFLGFIKAGLLLLGINLAVLMVVNSNDIITLDSNSFTSFFAGSNKISLLNAHLVENGLASDLSELSTENITPEEAEIFLFILKLSDSIMPTDAHKLAKLIIDECDNYNLDPFLILAVIQVESEFIPKAVSSKGAIGLMQMMPRTGEYVAKDLGISYKGRKSLYDPFVNIKLGIHYLSYLESRYNTMENALAAYNYGPGNFEKYKALAKNTPRYVKKVLNFKNFLKKESILLAKNS